MQYISNVFLHVPTMKLIARQHVQSCLTNLDFFRRRMGKEILRSTLKWTSRSQLLMFEPVSRRSRRRHCGGWHRGIILFIALTSHFLTTKKVNAGHRRTQCDSHLQASSALFKSLSGSASSQSRMVLISFPLSQSSSSSSR